MACAAPDYNRRPSESYGQNTNSYDRHGPGPVLDVHHGPGPVVDVHPGPGYDQPHPPPYNNRLTVRACREGEVLRGDGVCQHPEVTRRVYVYTPPVTPRSYIPPPPLPKPRVHTNVLIIRTPEDEEPLHPVVVPPAAQKNVIYVLDKKQENPQRVIELPPQPHHKPDVFFVHYKDGENPILHDGTDLHSALGAAGVSHTDGYGGDIVPDITVAGNVGIGEGGYVNHDVVLDAGYGGNAGHDVVVNTGYGGNAGHDVNTGYGGNVNTHPY